MAAYASVSCGDGHRSASIWLLCRLCLLRGATFSCLRRGRATCGSTGTSFLAVPDVHMLCFCARDPEFCPTSVHDQRSRRLTKLQSRLFTVDRIALSATLLCTPSGLGEDASDCKTAQTYLHCTSPLEDCVPKLPFFQIASNSHRVLTLADRHASHAAPHQAPPSPGLPRYMRSHSLLQAS
jgi:hypothetical protein